MPDKNPGESASAKRSRATTRRLETAEERDRVAQSRDRTATGRDEVARTRDAIAVHGDEKSEAREHRAVVSGGLDDMIPTLHEMRDAGATIRHESELERAAAATDRTAAAADRAQSATDRQYAGLDELTGFYRRGTGELALSNEIGRARRLQQNMVLTMIDVDGLKVVNDAGGHSAGDALLVNVAEAISSTMRSYDVFARWGGDEFVGGFSDLTLAIARDRMAAIQTALEQRSPGASISAGLAELRDDDTLTSLMARADAALYVAKGDRHR